MNTICEIGENSDVAVSYSRHTLVIILFNGHRENHYALSVEEAISLLENYSKEGIKVPESAILRLKRINNLSKFKEQF